MVRRKRGRTERNRGGSHPNGCLHRHCSYDQACFNCDELWTREYRSGRYDKGNAPWYSILIWRDYIACPLLISTSKALLSWTLLPQTSMEYPLGNCGYWNEPTNEAYAMHQWMNHIWLVKSSVVLLSRNTFLLESGPWNWPVETTFASNYAMIVFATFRGHFGFIYASSCHISSFNEAYAQVRPKLMRKEY